jgi:hypothetical protein
VERRGIEIRSVRPDKGAGLAIEHDLVEDSRILQRSEHYTAENRQKVDPLLRAVSERHCQRERPHEVERRYPVDRMGHGFLPEKINLDRRLTGLQEGPVVLELRSMYFRPRFNQA